MLVGIGRGEDDHVIGFFAEFLNRLTLFRAELFAPLSRRKMSGGFGLSPGVSDLVVGAVSLVVLVDHARIIVGVPLVNIEVDEPDLHKLISSFLSADW